MDSLDVFVIWYLIQHYFEEKNTDSVGIDHLLQGENLPGKLLQLNRLTLNQYLDELADQNRIVVNRTAGLDMVYQKDHIWQTVL